MMMHVESRQGALTMRNAIRFMNDFKRMAAIAGLPDMICC